MDGFPKAPFLINDISFFSEDVDFQLTNEPTIVKWIIQVISQYKHQLASLTYIFCSDSYLHQINVSFLQHDTFTDIITFPYAKSPLVESDIFISIDRVRENAKTYDVPFDRELNRVIIHGVLHLCGLKDKSEVEAKRMREAENDCLMLLDSLKSE